MATRVANPNKMHIEFTSSGKVLTFNTKALHKFTLCLMSIEGLHERTAAIYERLKGNGYDSSKTKELMLKFGKGSVRIRVITSDSEKDFSDTTKSLLDVVKETNEKIKNMQGVATLFTKDSEGNKGDERTIIFPASHQIFWVDPKHELPDPSQIPESKSQPSPTTSAQTGPSKPVANNTEKEGSWLDEID